MSYSVTPRRQFCECRSPCWQRGGAWYNIRQLCALVLLKRTKSLHYFSFQIDIIYRLEQHRLRPRTLYPALYAVYYYYYFFNRPDERGQHSTSPGQLSWFRLTVHFGYGWGWTLLTLRSQSPQPKTQTFDTVTSCISIHLHTTWSATSHRLSMTHYV